MQLQVSAITFKCNSLKRIPVELTGTLNLWLKSRVITESCQRLRVHCVSYSVFQWADEKLHGKVTVSKHSWLLLHWTKLIQNIHMEFIGTVWNCLQNIEKHTPDSAIWLNSLLLQNWAFLSAWQGYTAYKDTHIEHENTMCDSNFNYSKAFLSPGLEFAFHDCKLRWVTSLCHQGQSQGQWHSLQAAGSKPPGSCQPLPEHSSHQLIWASHGKLLPQQHIQCSSLWKRPSI